MRLFRKGAILKLKFFTNKPLVIRYRDQVQNKLILAKLVLNVTQRIRVSLLVNIEKMEVFQITLVLATKLLINQRLFIQEQRRTRRTDSKSPQTKRPNTKLPLPLTSREENLGLQETKISRILKRFQSKRRNLTPRKQWLTPKDQSELRRMGLKSLFLKMTSPE